MVWPETTHYNGAVQSPGECFTDAELRLGQVACDFLGLPRPFAGNFAAVYRVECPGGQTWAVKCFTRRVEDLQARYAAISAHLARENRAFNVEFLYLPEGVLVEGQPYPALKMRWVEGYTLNEFLAEHVEKSSALQTLARLWVKLAGELREAGMGHGDLQHGNVMLVPGSKEGSLALKLIDYDGMWVPALAGQPPGERGHPNYQHPTRLRDGGWGADVDHFSHLVVYTALRALQAGGRSLWDRYENGENLLFRAADFDRPADSALLRELWSHPDVPVRHLTGHLVLAAQGPLARVPFLPDLVSRGDVRPLSADERDRVEAVLGGGPPATSPPAPAQVAVLTPPSSGAVPVPEWLGGIMAGPFPAGPFPAAGTATVPTPPPPLPLPRRKSRLAQPAEEPLVALAAAAEADTGVDRPVTAVIVDPPPLPLPVAIPLPVPLPVKVEEPSRPRSRAEVVLEATPTAARPRRAPAPGVPPGVWLAGGAVLVALVLLGALALGWAIARALRPKPAPPVPRLAELPALTVKAGQVVEGLVQLDQAGTTGNLRLRAGALPAGLRLLGGEFAAGSSVVKVALAATPDAEAGPHEIVVALYDGPRRLQERTLSATVLPFLRPTLENVPALVLRPGQRVTMPVAVRRGGNDDPLTLEVDGLPPGVRLVPRDPGTAVLPVVFLDLEAEPAAEPRSAACKFRLLAGGVLADEKLGRVSVEVEPAVLSVALSADDAVTLKAGGSRALRVGISRTGFTGPVALRVEGLPRGLTADITPVPPGASEADLPFRAAEDVLRPNAVGLSLEARLVALVDGRPVGFRPVRVTVERAAEAPALRPPQPAPPRRPDLPQASGAFFPTADGVSLAGTFYPSPAGKASATVILLHGLNDHRREPGLVGLAEALQAAGHGVLTFDFRFHGQSTTAAGRFWSDPINKLFLGRMPPGRPQLTAADLPPAYLPNLVQDVVAARLWLDLRHDDADINSSNLVVVGVGEGAAVAAIWLNAEGHRWVDTTPPQKLAEVRDVAGFVGVGTDLQLQGDRRPAGWLAEPLRTARVPATFLLGAGDDLAPVRPRGFPTGVSYRPIPKTVETGHALLGAPGAAQAVVEVVDGLVRDRGLRPHAPRGTRSTRAVWMLQGLPAQVAAKTQHANVPLSLPWIRLR